MLRTSASASQQGRSCSLPPPGRGKLPGDRGWAWLPLEPCARHEAWHDMVLGGSSGANMRDSGPNRELTGLRCGRDVSMLTQRLLSPPRSRNPVFMGAQSPVLQAE